MDIQRKLDTLKKHNRRFGFFSALHLLLFQPLENKHWLRIGNCYVLALKDVSHDFAPDFPGFEFRPISPQELQILIQEGKDWFFPTAVEVSMSRGDVCFGGFFQGEVVCSIWGTTKPLEQVGLKLVPPNNGFFGYRSFTKPEYRGMRLRTAIQNYMIRYYKNRGFDWYFGVIYCTNKSSIAGDKREGFKRIGSIFQVGPDHWDLSKLISHGRPSLTVLTKDTEELHNL